MIFPVARLISFLSRDTSLLAGTLILTGTPAAVGFARRPLVLLAPGGRVSVEIEGIGTRDNPVQRARPPDTRMSSAAAFELDPD